MSTRRTPYLVGKAFNSFLLASVLTASASQVGNLIDGVMLSHFLDEKAMSAINLCMPVTQTLFALCMLLGVGGTMLAGVAIGNHDRPKASSLFSLVMATVAGIGILIGCVAHPGPLTGLLCPDESLKEYTSQYLAVILPASVVYMVMVVLQMFVTLDGSPRRVTAAVATATVVNLSLDYVFLAILGWGMTGAAIATVISYLAALMILAFHFSRPETLRIRFHGSYKEIMKVAAMGLPFGIATALIAVQLLGNNLVAMHYLGTSGIIALSVCMYLLSFSMIILTGTLESFQPVAAILKGSGDNNGVALVLGRAYRFLTVSLAILASVIIFLPGVIAGIFGIENPADSAMLHKALLPYAFNIILQCAVYLLIPVYQLYGHKGMALTISFGQPLLPMLCYWILSALAAQGIGWINPWWGFAIGQSLLVIILIPFILRQKGNHLPVVLIPKANPDDMLDLSVDADMKGMDEALRIVEKWLADAKVENALRLRIVLACEECLKNIITHGLSGKKSASAIDLRISLGASKVDAVIKDEGRPFNPVEYDAKEGIGLLILHKTCDRENYEYMFRQNILNLSWDREESAL